MQLRLVAEVAARAIVDGACPPDFSCAPDYPAEGDRIAAALFLERLSAGVDPRPFGVCLIVVDDTVIGGIGFHGEPDADGRVEVGYGVVPSQRGKGYATAALRMMVDKAKALGARLLVAETDPDNPASRTVLERADFRCTGGGEAMIRFELPLG